MKKLIALMISLLLCFSMAFVACNDDPEESSSEESESVDVSGLPEENTDGDNIIIF